MLVGIKREKLYLLTIFDPALVFTKVSLCSQSKDMAIVWNKQRYHRIQIQHREYKNHEF